jgi:hypothetical protein
MIAATTTLRARSAPTMSCATAVCRLFGAIPLAANLDTVLIESARGKSWWLQLTFDSHRFATL